MRWSKKTLILLFLILLLGAFLRVHSLGEKSYWLDESISVFQAERPVSDIVKMMHDDMAQPLHTLLLKGWILLFGSSETATRSLSAVFGVLLILVVYLLGRELFDEQVGLFGALFAAVSPALVWFSQEARPYMIFAFFTVCSYYFLVRYLRRAKAVDAVLYALSSIAFLYSNAYGVFVLFTQNIIFLLSLLPPRPFFPILPFRRWDMKKRTRLVRWLLLQIAIVLAFALGLWLIYYQYFNNIAQLGWIPPLDALSLVSIFSDVFGSPLLFLLALAIFVVASLLRRPKQYPRENILLLVLWIAVPLAILMVYSWFVKPLLVYRYVLFVVPAICLLLASAMCMISGNRYVRLAIAAVLVLAALPVVLHSYDAGDKADWRGAAQYLQQHADAGARIIVHPGYLQVPFLYYYGPVCFHPPVGYRYVQLRLCSYERYAVLSPLRFDGCCDDTTAVLTRLDASGDVPERSEVLGTMHDGVIWLVVEEHSRDGGMIAYLQAKKNLTHLREFNKIVLYRFE
ncbi:TPA: hypothetical protein HA251_01750 [Candidatus Woesearchaeota archaeon]|nr:hypothetical protein [Candidatus Woesearchaeota archaeon]